MELRQAEPLTMQQLKVAKLLFENELSHYKIAEVCGCHRNTITEWKREPTFQAEIERLSRMASATLDAEIAATLDFQRIVQANTHKLYGDVFKRIQDAIDGLEDIVLSRTLPPLVRAARDLTELALATDDSVLGLESIAARLESSGQ